MNHFPPKTVVITYEDGSELRVPFISQNGLDDFLKLENDISDVKIVDYKGD